MSFSFLKWQRIYVRTDVKKRVESMHGTNVSLPRTTLERFGLWDECTPIEDEPSLAFRIAAGKRDDEYLLFDPSIRIVRRLDVPGGMAKRTLSGPAYARRVFTYLHNIVGHYFPARFVALYPAYYVLVAWHVTQWIWSDSKIHRTMFARARATGWLYATMPVLWVAWLGAWTVRRWREPPRYAPLLVPEFPDRSDEHELALVTAGSARS